MIKAANVWSSFWHPFSNLDKKWEVLLQTLDTENLVHCENQNYKRKCHWNCYQWYCYGAKNMQGDFIPSDWKIMLCSMIFSAHNIFRVICRDSFMLCCVIFSAHNIFRMICMDSFILCCMIFSAHIFGWFSGTHSCCVVWFAVHKIFSGWFSGTNGHSIWSINWCNQKLMNLYSPLCYIVESIHSGTTSFHYMTL